MIKWLLTNIILLICFVFIDVHPMVSGLLVFLVNVVYYLIERMNRASKVNQLNNYLSSLNRGIHDVQVDTYQEGELSVLQAELYKLSVTLSHQNDLLVEKQTFVQDSLNDIAHQIKTPLTSMMLMTDLMLDGELPKAKQQEFIESIQKQLDRLKLLIANLMTLSKLEANVIKYNPTWISDAELLDLVIEPFEVMMELKEIDLHLSTSNQQVYIDVDWTVEALSNLVKNAVEHSKENQRILIQSEISQLYWRIIIEDNGKGINVEDIDHIFERFYRGQNASSDSVGIGLSLTQRIINQQQGQISVESQEGQFTRFKIEFYRKPRKDEENETIHHHRLPE